MAYEIDCIGGIVDGKRYAFPELLPEIRFPVMPKIDFKTYGLEDAGALVRTRCAVYRRIADTMNYIYIRTE